MKKTTNLIIGGLCLSCMCSAIAAEIPASKIVVPAGCSRKSATEYVVRVPQRSNIPNTTAGLNFTPDVRQLAGKTVTFSADLKSSGIGSDASGSHVGGKILIACRDSSGYTGYLATKSITGTSDDWQNCSIEVNVPANAVSLNVVFGIQQGWGTLEIRNPRMDYDAPAAKSSGPALIPASKIVVPAGCSRKSANEYTVRVAQRGSMPNTTAGLNFNPGAGRLAGKSVIFSAELKSIGIDSNASGSHVGGKILVSTRDSSGRMQFWATKSLTGTSGDWEKYSVRLDLPEDLRSINVVFGIQQGWGTLEVRNPGMEIVSNELPDGTSEIPVSSLVPDSNSRKTANGCTVQVPKRTNIGNSTSGFTFKPSLKQVAGKQVTFSADLKNTGIASDASGSHVGGKILVICRDGSGYTRYLASRSLTGTASEAATYSVSLKVPHDVKALNVVYGIQQAWGKLEVSNPCMTIE